MRSIQAYLLICPGLSLALHELRTPHLPASDQHPFSGARANHFLHAIAFTNKLSRPSTNGERSKAMRDIVDTWAGWCKKATKASSCGAASARAVPAHSRIMYELTVLRFPWRAAGRSSFDKRVVLERENGKATTDAQSRPASNIRRVEFCAFSDLSSEASRRRVGYWPDTVINPRCVGTESSSTSHAGSLAQSPIL